VIDWLVGTPLANPKISTDAKAKLSLCTWVSLAKGVPANQSFF